MGGRARVPRLRALELVRPVSRVGAVRDGGFAGAAAFGLPVVCIIDASAMAQTFAALATGLARFRPELHHCGVIANRVGSPAHGRMVGEGLPDDLPLIAALPREPKLILPERHLGLVQALEQPELDAQLDAWADAWEAGLRPGLAFKPGQRRAIKLQRRFRRGGVAGGRI